MTIEQKVTNFLSEYPKARERKVRSRVVWALLGLGEGYITKENFADYFIEIQSLNRMINRVQQLNKNLRGSDYEDKKKLEQEEMIKLGYEPGYHQNIKKLNSL